MQPHRHISSPNGMPTSFREGGEEEMVSQGKGEAINVNFLTQLSYSGDGGLIFILAMSPRPMDYPWRWVHHSGGGDKIYQPRNNQPNLVHTSLAWGRGLSGLGLLDNGDKQASEQPSNVHA